ncbi:uncharacterized protein DS421_16g537280 [Arachis hypogaea]|nr:uncharacterized protein DS421_16g537280 [Arachis hypogaea]
MIGWAPPDKGWKKLNVDGSIFQLTSDSKCAVSFILQALEEMHVGSSLVRSMRELLKKLEHVVIRHVFCKAKPVCPYACQAWTRAGTWGFLF